MTFYTKDELLDVLKSLDREDILYIHVFPFFNDDILTFYTYLCDVRSSNALLFMLSSEIRYTYNIK